MNIVQKLHRENLKTNVPEFGIGDTVKVEALIVEAGKERKQAFTGTVIARRGEGITEVFTVRRISYGQGVERVFPVHSPRIADIEVIRRGAVKRAKLYYLRDLAGKSTRIKEKRQARA